MIVKLIVRALIRLHAAETQYMLVDTMYGAEVAEIKRAVFRALTRLRSPGRSAPTTSLSTRSRR